MQEIGIFCGTFNPIHLGHLLLAEFAREEFSLSKIYMVTSSQPPHRQKDLLKAEFRHELVKAACAENPFFIASSIELERNGPSYTVDTLKYFQKEFSSNNNYRLNLLVGEDNVAYLKDWHDSKELFSLCRLLIASRHNELRKDTIEKLLPESSQFEIIHFMQLPISSSLIRKRIKEGFSIRYLVGEPVNKLIQEKQYYK